MTATVYALCNQKGGVGKTTATTNLANAFARKMNPKTRKPYRTLVIDDDPQANATSNFGLPADPELTLNDVMVGNAEKGGEVVQGSIADAVVPLGEDWAHIDFVAAELALAAREQDQNLGREFRLREALSGAIDNYDFVFIDCPPSLGQLTISALVASDFALLITEPRAASVDGLTQIVNTITTVRKHFNPGLQLAGVLVNKYKPTNDRKEWLKRIQSDYGDLVLDPVIREQEMAARATSESNPLSAYGAKSKELTQEFDSIATELIRRAKKGK